jgi:hypothetical protein
VAKLKEITMQSKPDVRPPVTGHPDSAKSRPDAGQEAPVDLNQLEGEIARRLFHEKGGDDLLKNLRQISGTLKMYQQDVDRGLENVNPEKFRWRVKPAEAQRLRKEEKQVETELQKLLDECKAEAEKMVRQMYPAEPTIHVETQSGAPGQTSTHQPSTEKGDGAQGAGPHRGLAIDIH